MRWNQEARTFKAYLSVVYILSLPAVVYCLIQPGQFNSEWVALTFVSAFVATINVRLPKISSVISMGDVFVILSLLNFGPGPTLVMYWIHISVAHIADTIRKHGIDIRGKFIFHRFFFNVSCCALSVYAMQVSREPCNFLLSAKRVLASSVVPCGDSFELLHHQHSHPFACDFVLDEQDVLVRLEGRAEFVCHEFCWVRPHRQG